MQWAYAWLWSFDTLIVGYNPVADPVFEVYHPSYGWMAPTGFASKFPYGMLYTYGWQTAGATMWRIQTPPTGVWWTPRELPTPISGMTGP